MNIIEKLLSKNSSEIKTRTAGNLGEDEAVRVLKKMGYKIIERNFTVRGGEIDIIAKEGEYTCFVEVRMRKSNSYGSPAETIDLRKQKRIIKAAQLYAMKNAIYDSPMRFDVVLINADSSGGKLKNKSVEVIQDAFRF